MECKNNTVTHQEHCEKPRIKKEHVSHDVITASQISAVQYDEKHFLQCVQSSHKVGVLQDTWNPAVAYCNIKSDPNQPSTFLGTGTIKCEDGIEIKEEYITQDEVSPKYKELHLRQHEAYFIEKVSVDLDPKVGIKQEAWDPNVVSSDIKCDPEQHPTLDPVPRISPSITKGDDKIFIKEELWGYEETLANSLNEGEESDSKRNQAAEDAPLLESSSPHTTAMYSSSYIQLHKNENTSISAPNCERKHSCKICGKNFQYLKYFKKHILAHNDKRLHKCQFCEKSFKHLGKLREHLLIHDDKRQFQCQVCEKRFKQLQGLKLHLLVHDEKRPYTCHICEKSFKLLPGLKSHLLMHDDKRQYNCEICEKSFKQLKGLKSHLLVHDDKKRHKCKVCEKSFKHLQGLKLHLLVHDDKRPYTCKMCEKSFKLLPGLKSHLLVHDNKRQHKCQFCEKSYKYKNSLKVHLLLHDNKR